MKIAVIGGGASGLCCAIAAADKAHREKINADITIYEAKDRVGKKILATGNGRCNMLNMHEIFPYFGDREFASVALKKHDAESNLSFFAEIGLYTRTDEEGRVYPLSNQASSVLDVLRFECVRLGVKIITDIEIKNINAKKGGFVLNNKIFADKLVLACGSAAGVKGFGGYELLKSLDHTVTKVAPSLTKLIVNNNTYIKQLKGVRQKAELKLIIDRKIIATEKGEVLFADYGLSGIAAMQLSAYVTRHFIKSKKLPTVALDLVPDMDEEFLKNAVIKICRHSKNGKAENILTGFMPKKIGEALLKQCGISLNAQCSDLSVKDIEKLVYTAKNWCFEISGVKDFSEAQVAAGGALCSEFSSQTLESKKHKGLYCCGEILDVDGLCGGYNLHWAWSSGRLCGESVVTGDNI